MLRDGNFIREDPPKIGAHYVPQLYSRPATPEERFVQDIILSVRPIKQSPITKILERLLAI
jgi:hypothetical protein